MAKAEKKPTYSKFTQKIREKSMILGHKAMKYRLITNNMYKKNRGLRKG